MKFADRIRPKDQGKASKEADREASSEDQDTGDCMRMSAEMRPAREFK